MEIVKRFWKDESGLETVEYAIILGLVVAGTIALIAGIGQWVNGRFSEVSQELGVTE